MNSFARNRKTLLGACLAFLFGITSTFSQESADLPSGPLIKPPTVNAHWILEFSSRKPADGKAVPSDQNPSLIPPSPRPKTMDISNADGIRLINTKYDNGKSETAYVVPGSRLVKKSSDEIQVLGKLEPSHLEYDTPLGVYPGFQWIDRSNFRGVVRLNDQEYYRYSQEANTAAPKPGITTEELFQQIKANSSEAYVDKKTLLPYAYVYGDTIVTYRFAGVSEPIALPEEYQKAIRRQAGARY